MMEKADSYPAVHQQYPSQMEPIASTTTPANFTPATVYSSPYTSLNTSTPFMEITTKPATQLPDNGQQYNLEVHYPSQYAEHATGYLASNKKNKPQFNSVGAIAMIFCSGGMNIAWSCRYRKNLDFTVTKHMTICWLIAAIIGATSSAILTKFVPKKSIYLIASLLVLFGGVLFLTWPYYAAPITAALYFDGFANGLAIVPMLLLAGEEIIPFMRGKVASLIEVMSYTTGIFLQIFFVSLFGKEYNVWSFDDTQIHGLLSIIFGVISLIITACNVIESPIYYLQRDAEDRAIDSLRCLQRPYTITHDTYRLLNDAKVYVDTNRADQYIGLPALLKICIYRGLGALCFSHYTTFFLEIVTEVVSGTNVVWTFIVSGILLWIGSFIAGFMLDFVGRKWHVLAGALFCGCMTLSIGIIFNKLYAADFNTALYFFFIFQFFAGFFISATPVCSTEAFPLRFKSYYVATAFIVQMLVLIIVGLCDVSLEGLAVYFITMGLLYLIFFFLALLFMPETKNDTLHEAQDKFRTIFSGCK